MSTILERIQSKPSIALQAMIDGLLDVKNQPQHRIDMGTFFTYEKATDICFKCAATCTIENLYGYIFSDKDINNENVDHLLSVVSIEELEFLQKFEEAMESARLSYVGDLFDFCNIPFTISLIEKFQSRFRLTDNNHWEDELPEIRKIIKELQELGY